MKDMFKNFYDINAKEHKQFYCINCVSEHSLNNNLNLKYKYEELIFFGTEIKSYIISKSSPDPLSSSFHIELEPAWRSGSVSYFPSSLEYIFPVYGILDSSHMQKSYWIETIYDRTSSGVRLVRKEVISSFTYALYNNLDQIYFGRISEMYSNSNGIFLSIF